MGQVCGPHSDQLQAALSLEKGRYNALYQTITLVQTIIVGPGGLQPAERIHLNAGNSVICPGLRKASSSEVLLRATRLHPHMSPDFRHDHMNLALTSTPLCLRPKIVPDHLDRQLWSEPRCMHLRLLEFRQAQAQP